jgi:hypothetical protein
VRTTISTKDLNHPKSPSSMPITYRSGYKYQLVEDYIHPDCGLKPPTSVMDHPFIQLTEAGQLTIKAGYAWDGPSGPTVDTKNFMRGSLVHDALYQLMRERENQLPLATYRNQADLLLRDLCIEDGMSTLRAGWVYQAVRLCGEPSAKPENEHKPITAP